MIEISRWKEVSRRSLTAEELAAIIEGNSPYSGERSFDIAIHTKVKERVQIIYERLPYEPDIEGN